MLSFKVSGEGNLFGELVCALIQAACPEADVSFEAGAVADPAGVSVLLEGTDRWLFVSTGRGPSTAAAAALGNGACAVLSLDSRAEDFERALDALLRDDGSYVPAEMVRWMAGATLQKSGPDGHPGLARKITFREREVLALVAAGQSNVEIGKTLMISANTVRSHLHALSVKLEATSRTHMLANARALGLPEANGQPGGFQQSA